MSSSRQGNTADASTNPAIARTALKKSEGTALEILSFNDHIEATLLLEMCVECIASGHLQMVSTAVDKLTKIALDSKIQSGDAFRIMRTLSTNISAAVIQKTVPREAFREITHFLVLATDKMIAQISGKAGLELEPELLNDITGLLSCLSYELDAPETASARLNNSLEKCVFMLPETAQTEILFTIVDHLIRSLLRTRHQGLSTPLIRAILKIVLHLGSISQFEAAETSLHHVFSVCQNSERESRTRLGAAILREAALLIEEKHDQGHLYAFALYFRLFSSVPTMNTAGQVRDFAGHDSAHAWSTALKCGTRILIESFPKLPEQASAVVNAQNILAGIDCKPCTEALLERAKRSLGLPANTLTDIRGWIAKATKLRSWFLLVPNEECRQRILGEYHEKLTKSMGWGTHEAHAHSSEALPVTLSVEDSLRAGHTLPHNASTSTQTPLPLSSLDQTMTHGIVKSTVSSDPGPLRSTRSEAPPRQPVLGSNPLSSIVEDDAPAGTRKSRDANVNRHSRVTSPTAIPPLPSSPGVVKLPDAVRATVSPRNARTRPSSPPATSSPRPPFVVPSLHSHRKPADQARQVLGSPIQVKSPTHSGGFKRSRTESPSCATGKENSSKRARLDQDDMRSPEGKSTARRRIDPETPAQARTSDEADEEPEFLKVLRNAAPGQTLVQPAYPSIESTLLNGMPLVVNPGGLAPISESPAISQPGSPLQPALELQPPLASNPGQGSATPKDLTSPGPAPVATIPEETRKRKRNIEDTLNAALSAMLSRKAAKREQQSHVRDGEDVEDTDAQPAPSHSEAHDKSGQEQKENDTAEPAPTGRVKEKSTVSFVRRFTRSSTRHNP